jgi:hypothetical protein
LKRSLLWSFALLAAAATGILGIVALYARSPAKAPRPAGVAPPVAAATSPASEEPLRPYETTVTLTEDLRDALAGPPAALAAVLHRVSGVLPSKARWTLANTAPEEASPKVRALLVYAAGVHLPDEELLLGFLADREPVVRRAAALATARGEGEPFPLLAEVEVPVGRALPEATRRALEERLEREEDEGVRGALLAALSSRSR